MFIILKVSIKTQESRSSSQNPKLKKSEQNKSTVSPSVHNTETLLMFVKIFILNLSNHLKSLLKV